MESQPLITITVGVRGAIHEHFIEQLNNLKLPKSDIKTLVKSLHHNAIKYLIYLVLNKRKFDNKQTPPPLGEYDQSYTTRAHLPKRHKAPYYIMGDMISIGLTGSHSCRYIVRALFFLLFSFTKGG